MTETRLDAIRRAFEHAQAAAQETLSPWTPEGFAIIAEAALDAYDESPEVIDACAKALYELAVWCAVNLDGEDSDDWGTWAEVTDEEVRDGFTIRATTVLRAARGVRT